MKRIDRLIVGEMIGPWFFGVAIFTVLIMAGTFLFKITDYFVQGIGFATVIELTALLLPGVMAKTFPMAVLLATLLSFGRLSGDSEIVALKAAGTSVVRMSVPVAVFGILVSLLTFGVNELIVPRAAIRATTLQSEIAKKLSGSAMRPTFYPIFNEGGKGGTLYGLIMARDFNFATGTLRGATIQAYDKNGEPTFDMYARELTFSAGKDWQNSWRIRGGGTIRSADGTTHVELLGDAWPEQIPTMTATPTDLITASLKDLDSFSMGQMAEQIERAESNPKIPRGQIANLKFGYWNKIAVPLAAFIFALVGAPLGIRSHRTGSATGFWLSVIIIFGYMMMANLMSIYAIGGLIPPALASFGPILVGLVAAAVLIARRNS